MTKSEFRDRIKSLVKQVYSGATKSTEVDLDTVSAVSLDTTRFPVLAKFPTLRDTIIKLYIPSIINPYTTIVSMIAIVFSFILLYQGMD